MDNQQLYEYIKKSLIEQQDSTRRAMSGTRSHNANNQLEVSNQKALDMLEKYKDNADSLNYIYNNLLRTGLLQPFNETPTSSRVEDIMYKPPAFQNTLPELTVTGNKPQAFDVPGLRDYLQSHNERRRGWFNKESEGRGSTTQFNNRRDKIGNVLNTGDDKALNKAHDQFVEHEGLIPYQSMGLYDRRIPQYNNPLMEYNYDKLNPILPQGIGDVNPQLRMSTNGVSTNPHISIDKISNGIGDEITPQSLIDDKISASLAPTLTSETASSLNTPDVKSKSPQFNPSLLRFAPAVGSLIDALTPESAEVTRLPRMSMPEKVIAGEISETQHNPMFDSQYNKTVGDIVNTSGGSASAARANIQGAGINTGRSKAQAISDIIKFNQSNKQRVNAINSTNQMRTNSVNANIGVQESIANEQNRAAARNNRHDAWVNLIDSLGNIGIEDFRRKAVGAGTGYDPYTNKKI